MDKIINYLLLIIIFVFDPLAIALVIAANFAFEQSKTLTFIPNSIKIRQPLHPHLNRWELVVPSQYLNPGFRRLKIGYKPGFKGESLLPLRARRGFLFDWCGFLEIKRQNQSVTDISGSLRSLFVRH